MKARDRQPDFIFRFGVVSVQPYAGQSLQLVLIEHELIVLAYAVHRLRAQPRRLLGELNERHKTVSLDTHVLFDLNGSPRTLDAWPI